MPSEPPILDYRNDRFKQKNTNLRRRLLKIFGSIFGVILVLYFGVNWFIFGSLFAPTTHTYTQIALTHEYLARAVLEYTSDHGGIYPDSIEDLVPKYIPTKPLERIVFYMDGVGVNAAPHTYVYYSFRPSEEGWHVAGDWGNGPLPLPKIVSTRPATSSK